MRALVALLVALVACSAGPTIAPRDCTPGATSACACPGASGVQTCGADGRLGACLCADGGAPQDAPPAAADAPPAPDAAPDAPTPVLDAEGPQDRPQGADAVDASPGVDAGVDVPRDATDDATDAGRVISCPAPQVLCGTRCADLRAELTNCGACGVACAPGQVCEMGVCGISCPAGRTLCGATCADINNDPLNCGGCGTVCPSRNSSPFCRNRACGQECAAGFSDCDGDRVNGCETSTTANRLNCGACGVTCGNTERCAGGACVPGCVGGCGPAAVCNAGECVPCPAGRVACGNTCRDLQSDRAHCGACGAACPQPAGATVACVNAACTLTACADPTYRDCDGNAANGCEMNIVSDRNNCGACGVRCGARQMCTAGRCVCQTGTDNLCGNACYLFNDPLNCGACGRVCSDRQTCNGSCVDCQPDTSTATWRRCENRCVDTMSDGANCGACGNVCASGRLCFFGVCR